MRARLRLVLAGPLVTALVALALAAPPPAAAQAQAACAAPVPSDTQPGYAVADPWCDFPGGAPFAPLTDAAGAPLSQVHAGIDDGAAWRIEVPHRWNGELVLHAHGYRGEGTTVWVDDPGLRAHFVQRGFAWAASSYQTNSYDLAQGVRDTHALIDLVRRVTDRQPGETLITGPSMGGHVTAVAVEHYRGTFAGAMPTCGVLGDTDLFDYFTDANVTAAALTGTPITFPLQPPPDYPLTYQQQVLGELPQLGSGFTAGTPPTFTPLGLRWGAAVEQRSGGSRPGFASAFAFWNSFGFAPLTGIPFLFGLYPGAHRRHRQRRRRQRGRQPAHRLPAGRRPAPVTRGAAPERRGAAGRPDRARHPRPVGDPGGGRGPPHPGALAPRPRGPVRAVLDGAGLRQADRPPRAAVAVRLPRHPRHRPLRLHPGRAGARLRRPGDVGAHRPPAGRRPRPQPDPRGQTDVRLPLQRRPAPQLQCARLPLNASGAASAPPAPSMQRRA
jgi:hypothetical protein